MTKLFRLRELNKMIRENKELIARSRKLYVNTARLAKSANINWTRAQHNNIQTQLRRALEQTKALEAKVKDLQTIRPVGASLTIQSAWRGYTARRNTAGSRRPQVPHRSNYNRRLRRSHRPQTPP